jgi:hypothetical protein
MADDVLEICYGIEADVHLRNVFSTVLLHRYLSVIFMDPCDLQGIPVLALIATFVRSCDRAS